MTLDQAQATRLYLPGYWRGNRIDQIASSASGLLFLDVSRTWNQTGPDAREAIAVLLREPTYAGKLRAAKRRAAHLKQARRVAARGPYQTYAQSERAREYAQ
jgi:hypothetical protein